MKKQLVLMVIAALFSIAAVNAQGGQQRLTPEESTKSAIEKMAPLKMNDSTKGKAEVIMLDFYKTQQTALEEMRNSGSMDREAFMAKRKELADARDGKLKLIFTAEQMKQWIDEIEATTRPQRGNRPSGN